MNPKKKILHNGKEVSLNPADYPWNYPGMVMCPGRYCYGFIHVPVKAPDNERNCDLTGMLWRYTEPGKEQEWYFTSRIRFYAGADNDPWDGQDRRKWGVLRCFNLNAEGARKRVDSSTGLFMLTVLAGGGIPLVPEWFVVEGTEDAYFEKMKQPPHWFHGKEHTADEKGNQRVQTRGWHAPSQ